MIHAVLSIGSNLDERLRLLRTVPESLGAREDVQLVAASSVYATAPWGVTDQGEFLNAALLVRTRLSPLELLRVGQELEQRARRRRLRRWGPRTLDVDIVTVTDATGAELSSADPTLTLPHPHAYHRAFVLIPWLEIDPKARLARRRVAELVAELDPAERAGVFKTVGLRRGRSRWRRGRAWRG